MGEPKVLKFRWYDQWLLGWADMIDASIRVITFGNIIPLIGWKVFVWTTDRRLKDLKG